MKEIIKKNSPQIVFGVIAIVFLALGNYSIAIPFFVLALVTALTKYKA